MILDDRACDRQPHANSMRLAGVERIEDLLQALRLDPDAEVLQSDEHVIRFVSTRRDE